VTLDGRVRTRLDELQHAADQGMDWTPEVGAGDIAAPYIASDNSSWALGVWLPSLRERWERHGNASDFPTQFHGHPPYYGCAGCHARWPCPDALSVCHEIGVDPDQDTPQQGGTT
jgi:hypothetical protein